MSEPTDPVTDADLNQYVDGVLPAGRRIEVEAHLALNPSVAARVMADLRNREELRLSLLDGGMSGRPATEAAARRLAGRLRRMRWVMPMQRAAAVALLISSGWIANSLIGPIGVRPVDASALPPAYLQEAVAAHRTGLLRARMASQPEAPVYDRAEIKDATSIDIPVLPDAWRVLDVQVFPSDYGPSLEMAIDAEGLGLISLFAIRPGSDMRAPVAVAHQDGLAQAYWQSGHIAYVMSASAKDRDLAHEASKLATADQSR